MNNHLWRTVLIAISTITFAIAAEPPSRTEDSHEASERNAERVLQVLRPVLRSAREGARLYYQADCPANSGDPVPFPAIKIEQAAKQDAGFSAVQKIFGNDSRVRVKKERSNVISIQVGEVSAEILRTKLTSLKLEAMEQYNATEVIGAIENTEEFRDAARALGIVPVWSYSAFVTEPRKGLPHLPETIRNMTVEQILDLIAKTFKGVVIYGECSGPAGERSIWIDFARIEAVQETEISRLGSNTIFSCGEYRRIGQIERTRWD